MATNEKDIEIKTFQDATIFGQQDIPAQEGAITDDVLAGQGNTKLPEIKPRYNKAPNETIVPEKRKSNAFIVFGKDRRTNRRTGYGGTANTRSAAIDIVVGLQGWNPTSGMVENEAGDLVAGSADKSFGSMSADKPGDAARIYISQRCDVDDYFDICKGEVGISKADSAIALKADSVRILARKGIKLVTQSNTGRLANSGKQGVIYGIDLIAGNLDIDDGKPIPGIKKTENEIFYLQPIPKGYNLEECLEQYAKLMMTLNSKLSGVITLITLLTRIMGVPKFGIAAPAGSMQIVDNLPIIEGLLTYALTRFRAIGADLLLNRKNIVGVRADYLSAGAPAYINSRHNRTN
jgi:hypothetical protein